MVGQNYQKYQAILRAIGGGRTELNDIGHGAGLPGDTTLRDKIERLIGLEYVRQERNVGAGSTVPFRYSASRPAQSHRSRGREPYRAARRVSCGTG